MVLGAAYIPWRRWYVIWHYAALSSSLRRSCPDSTIIDTRNSRVTLYHLIVTQGSGHWSSVVAGGVTPGNFRSIARSAVQKTCTWNKFASCAIEGFGFGSQTKSQSLFSSVSLPVVASAADTQSLVVCTNPVVLPPVPPGTLVLLSSF